MKINKIITTLLTILTIGTISPRADFFTSGHSVIQMNLIDATPGSEQIDMKLVVSSGGIVGGNAVATNTPFSFGNITPVIPIEAFLSSVPNATWDITGGSSAYYRSSSDTPNPGFGVELVESSIITGNALKPATFELISVTGPGDYTFFSSTFGSINNTVFASSDGIDSSDKLELTGGHSHQEIAFSEQGAYNLTFKASAFMDNGFENLVTFTDTLTVHVVVPEPAHYALITSFVLLLIIKFKARKN